MPGQLAGFIIETAFLPNAGLEFPQTALAFLSNRQNRFNQGFVIEHEIELNRFNRLKSHVDAIDQALLRLAPVRIGCQLRPRVPTRWFCRFFPSSPDDRRASESEA